MSPDDELLPPTDLPPEDEQRPVANVDTSGLPDAVGTAAEVVQAMPACIELVGDIVSAGGEVVGEVAGAAAEVAGAAGEAVGSAGEVLGAVAEGASGCSCVVVFLALCLTAGSALAVTLLR